MNIISKIFKIFFPFILILIFASVIRFYYDNNTENFFFFNNIDLKYVLILIFFGFLYLFLETLILNLIVKFNNKQVSFLELFSVINVTYFCNSFVQFSGLGFRAYYLKKNLNISYSSFLSISIFIIFIELFVFSFLSYSIIKFYEIKNKIDILNLNIEIFLILIFSSIFIIFFFKNIIFDFLKKNFLINKISILKKTISIFDDILKRKFEKIIPSIVTIFLLQFLIIVIICSLSFNLHEQNLIRSLLFGVISAMSIDLSFIFSITPYSIGISELFITYSTINFNLNLANVLSTANSFRFSLMVFYFIITPIYFLLKTIKKN